MTDLKAESKERELVLEISGMNQRDENYRDMIAEQIAAYRIWLLNPIIEELRAIIANLAGKSPEPSEKPCGKCWIVKSGCDTCGPPSWEGFRPAEEPDYTLCEEACRGDCPGCTKPAEEQKPESCKPTEIDGAMLNLHLTDRGYFLIQGTVRGEPRVNAMFSPNQAAAIHDFLHNRIAEPAEERGPEVGDAVLWMMQRDIHATIADAGMIEAFRTLPLEATPIVLMRRAEVAARMQVSE